MASVTLNKDHLVIEGDLTVETVPVANKRVRKLLGRAAPPTLYANLSRLGMVDSAGVAFLEMLRDDFLTAGTAVHFLDVPHHVQESIDIFSGAKVKLEERPGRANIFEQIGEWIVNIWREIVNLLYLLADSAYFAIAGLFTSRGIRKGEFVNQCILIGMNALPIVALISFLIGFILALQSAAQLRQFGASIFVADLVAISMTREMGPIMTAVILAGRSGSAIAAEIATMVVTEETDALKSMALNPVRYILVPKMYAITTMMPLLTVLSMIIGILGALTIGVTYLELGVKPFYNEVVSVLILKDVLTGLVKSIVFAWIIVLVGAFYGFRVKGGAEGVGRATTASVVASIFMVILADSILGLIFYFGKGLEY